MAAEAAALLEMVAGFAAKKGHGSAEPLIQQGRKLRAAFIVQAERDSAAYTQVLSAYRLPKDAPGRREAIARALRAATLSPLAVLDLTIELVEAIREAEAICPASMRSDWESAVVLCDAVVKVSVKNAAANFEGADGAGELKQRLEEKLASLAQITPRL